MDFLLFENIGFVIVLSDYLSELFTWISSSNIYKVLIYFRLAVCDTDQKEITIDETYCWSVDHLGRPIDIYSEADYRMQVI